MSDIDVTNECRLLAEALRRAADWLDGFDAIDPSKDFVGDLVTIDATAFPIEEPEYVHLQEYLMGVVKQLDLTGEGLVRVTEELLGTKEDDLKAGEFTEGEYVEWLKRQIKTAEQNVESRKRAA